MFPPVDCGPRTRGRRGGDRRGVGETTVHGMSSFPKDKDTARRSLNFSPSTLSLLAATLSSSLRPKRFERAAVKPRSKLARDLLWHGDPHRRLEDLPYINQKIKI